MHYFDMTRLGAFLAIPLVYQSYYNGDAYADAKSYEEEKKAEALRPGGGHGAWRAAGVPRRRRPGRRRWRRAIRSPRRWRRRRHKQAWWW